MIEVSQVLQIKQMYGQGMKIRQISRELSLSRNTVRRYLRGAVPGEYRLVRKKPQPVRSRMRPLVEALLEEEKARETPRKQRLTAARIYRILQDRGHQCSESLVGQIVREYRRSLPLLLEKAYIPLAYQPGRDAQVDFFEAWVDDLTQGRIKIFVLLVRPCFSRRTYLYAAPNQTQEALFEGLMRSFEFFGGVFHTLWFDNLTPAVKKVLKGKARVLQEAFLSFQSHYGFQASFCAPGKGNEKGGVENNVSFARHETLSPIPKVQGRQEVQQIFDAFMAKETSRITAGQKHSIGRLWKEEVPFLLPLPARRFEPATSRSAKVTPRSWIQLATNFYSVPVEHISKRVSLKVLAEEIVVYDKRQEIARHPRLYGRYKMSLRLEHYLPLLRRKTRGVDRAIPVQQWLGDHDPCWETLLHCLRRREGEVQGSQSWIDLVELCKRYGYERMTEAVRNSLGHPSVSVATIRYFLAEEQAKKNPPPPISIKGPRVYQGSSSAYMCLTQGGEA